MVTLLEWSTFEYHHTHKTRDWYWAVGIIAFTGAVLALLFGNIIFAIFIVLSAFALCVHAAHPPALIKCEINNKGIVVQDRLFPYTTLDSFWVETLYGAPRLIIKSHKLLMPYLTLIITDVDPEDVRNTLLGYLKEEEHEEPWAQRLMEYFGF